VNFIDPSGLLPWSPYYLHRPMSNAFSNWDEFDLIFLTIDLRERPVVRIDPAGFALWLWTLQTRIGDSGGGDTGQNRDDPCAKIRGKGGVIPVRNAQTGEITTYGFDSSGQFIGYGRLISNTDVSGPGYFIPGGTRASIQLTTATSIQLDFSQP